MSFFLLGLAGSGRQEERASLLWAGHTTGKGKRELVLVSSERKALSSVSSSIVTVVVDSYTHSSTLKPGYSVVIGTQLILVCRVVGLPYGTPLSYAWTCQNGPCEVEGYYGRKVYNEHILAVNATSTSDGGTYTCRVTATGGQEATGSFTLTVTGMCVCLVLYYSSNGTGTSLVLHTHSGGRVVHSNGRLIPHQFPITDLQQISYSGVNHSVTCSPKGTLYTPINSTHSTPLGLNHVVFSHHLNNRDVYCDNSDTNYFYIYLTSSNNSE